MSITMDEIAKKLNISIATVSRALSGNGEGVAEETKAAIHRIAEKYGYQKRKSVGKNVAMVLVDEYIPSEDIPSVMIDNTDGILKACKYLHELKHTRVAYISEEKKEATAFERYYGFKQAQEMFGFINNDNLIAECGGRISEGFKAMEEILNSSEVLPTAVLAYNDIIAIGAMDAIKQHGLSIPENISVIGFDDISLAREVVPSLTSVHVPKHLMGIISVQRLIHVIQGKKDIIKKVLVPTRLKIRESTAPLQLKGCSLPFEQ